MKPAKIAYWVSTTLLCLIYASGAVMYLFQRPTIEEGFAAFGYPAYLVSLLIVAKIAAPLAILSRVSVGLSDLAYAGILFHLLLAASAHINVGDGGYFPALLGLVLAAVSFLTQNAARRKPSPNVPRALSFSPEG
ncbi:MULTISPECIES: DoxX family protein [unclassified Devosia]|uniref:DoxX family protein n=1 Tax=unclassified Devosia TaxID=196773 RepID=UPI0023D83DF7|nr:MULTISPECIES: DoxX family protein [unclassified Devosia]WEJ33701.1 DoxX family protein [Devosia sp. SD17-2]